MTRPARRMLANIGAQPDKLGKVQFLKETIEAFDNLPFQDSQNTRNNSPCDNATEYATPNDQKGELSFWCQSANQTAITYRGPR